MKELDNSAFLMGIVAYPKSPSVSPSNVVAFLTMPALCHPEVEPTLAVEHRDLPRRVPLRAVKPVSGGPKQP